MSVTITSESFTVLSIEVSDEASLGAALKEAQKVYDNGFEERYSEIRKRIQEQQKLRKQKIMQKKEPGSLAEQTTGTIREENGTELYLNSVEVDRSKLNQFNFSEKVSRSDMIRLCRGEARGMLDEDLLDDIGLTFYMRCKQAKEVRACIMKGQMLCLHCGAILYGGKVSKTGSLCVKAPENYIPITCKCGYSYTFREYRRKCNSDNVPGGRATPVFEQFLQKWPACRDSKEKFLVIDWLIHQCHVTLMSGEVGRSVGVNLIEGSLAQIRELIESLAYEPGC